MMDDVADFEPGQMVTVFRSRLRPNGVDEYVPFAAEIGELAHSMPGLIDVKDFVADDGERVTIVTFADEQSQRSWREHADHLSAQKRGRAEFYSSYSLQVCRTERVSRFDLPGAQSALE